MIRVVVFGVFDLLHPGHFAFLRQAKRLGDELIVVVTRDDAAAREKGRRPRLTVRERMQLVSGVRWVDRAVIGDPPDRYFAVLRRLKPDIIALGYDQPCDVPAFRSTLITLGLLKTRVVRLRKYSDGRHHSRALVRHE
ncbi:MAG: adenylyltransferase/cytidyltransferase family protein [bacterium]|nr:adenylyltransferase/cytidyltransferase family protein [bacterium]